MDILAHSLWAAAGAKGANAAAKKPAVHVGWAAFWGVFPDLFAFVPAFAVAIWAALQGGSFASFAPHLSDVVMVGGMPLPAYLYQFSHSLVIWVLAFLVAWAVSGRPRWELLGWALHILIDIPSHSAAFYPTPFLFPLSEYRFPYGVPWSGRCFMIVNYTLLLAVYGWVLLGNRRKARAPAPERL